jgi:hypothetical protein
VPDVPVTHAPVTHAPAHATAAYVPLEYSGPLAEPYHAELEELHHRPTARRSRRLGGRPVMLLGVAAGLVIGMHLLLTATPSASADPAESPAVASESENVEESAPVAREPGEPAVEPAVDAGEADVATPRVTTAPARVPMTPGPAFAGSVPARPGADTAATPRAAAAPAPAAAAPAIAPAPVAIDLGLPPLVPDSLAPTARTGDTLGMKKILRALNGPKPVEAPTAP